MAGGNWTPGVSPGRPGLYINFTEAAGAVIQPGALGTVAMPFTKAIDGTATVANFYTVDSGAQATELFGAANIASILYALQGGAKEVLVYTMSATPDIDAYKAAFAKYDTYKFDVFVFDSMVDDVTQDAALAWLNESKAEGKYFLAVFGCSDPADDASVDAGIARCSRLKDDFAVNLISGVVDGLNVLNSAQAAPYLAGLIASTALNASITYRQLPFVDVNHRLTSVQIKKALAAGALVLFHDGQDVRVERGLCTGGNKIRRARIQMAIAYDITRTANKSVIGRAINNEDGQIALISAAKTYLETLAADGVIAADSIVVKLSDIYPSIGDKVYLDFAFRDLDSMEEIYLTIQVG